MTDLSNIVIIATLILSFIFMFSFDLFILSALLVCLFLIRLLGLIEDIQKGLKEGRERKKRIKKQKERKLKERMDK